MSGPILVVEDDTDVREVLLETLSDAGYAAEGASDGLEALHKLRNGTHPSLVLLDLMMPRMNGRQFREIQQRDPAIARVPVVVFSADARIATLAHDLGVAGYLKKPVQLDALLDVAARFAS